MTSPAFEYGKQTIFLVLFIALSVQHTTTSNANLLFTVAIAKRQKRSNGKYDVEFYRYF